MKTIEVQITEETNPFLEGKKKEQIRFLAKLNAKQIDNLTQLQKCNVSDETMTKLIELAKSPKASTLLIDNWELIKSMM